MEAYISLGDPAVRDPEETDFYVVLEGSTLSHVTRARSCGGEGRLGFTVPGTFLLRPPPPPPATHTHRRRLRLRT